MESQMGTHRQKRTRARLTGHSGKFSHAMQIQHIFVRRTTPQLSPLQTKIHLYLSDKQIQRSLHRKDPPGPCARSPQPVTGYSSPVGEEGCVGPSSQVGPFRDREWQAWWQAVTGPGSSALTLPQQGGPQLPASTYPSTAKHRSYVRAWPLSPFDEQSWKAEASDLHNGLIYHTPPRSCLPPCTLPSCITACSSSLPVSFSWYLADTTPAKS